MKHIRTIPYHPASNGLVERFVQSFKQALRASQNDGRSLNNRLSTFLLTYRSTSHATTGVPPCTLFLRRKLRTRFDLLKPNCEGRVLEKQAKQKEKHDQRTKGREWHVGQSVMAKNLRPGPNWIPGVIVERSGPLSYVIETEDKQIWRRHVDQLKELGDGVAMDNSTDDSELTYPPPTSAANDEVTETAGTTDPVEPPQVEPVQPETESPDTSQLPVGEPVVPTSRYPTRVRKPPDRLH